MSEVWIRYKRLILKLSKVLRVEEVEGPFMHPNQRLQKWYHPLDIQLTVWYRNITLVLWYDKILNAARRY